jgi:hypothetical protein
LAVRRRAIAFSIAGSSSTTATTFLRIDINEYLN